jgi:CubicO group peptidase (beta-lactamase class C family)
LKASSPTKLPLGSAVLLLPLLVLSSCTGSPLEPGRSLEQFSAHLDAQIPRLLHRYGVPAVSMAIVHDGELAWSSAYGYADLEDDREMSVDAICRAESISKSVTAWGVMRLVEQGLVDLDSPVQRYLGDWQLPESQYRTEQITVRRLLSGNAGMPLGPIGTRAEYPPGTDMPSLRDYLGREALPIREPGSGFLYSNVGFNLLELVIEEVTGRDFAEYMAAEVLRPLGMRGSSYSWDEGYRSSLPMGYELHGAPVPPYVYSVRASGGLFTDAEDIARFVSASMTGPYFTDRSVLLGESIRLIHAPQVKIEGLFAVVADSYGFGHFIETLPDGRRAVWHGGQGHGWMTHFHLVPESGDGIVILTNSQRSWPFIAKVLSEWATWRGLGSVGFGRITYATTTLWAIIGAVGLATLWLAYRLVRGLLRGARRLAPLGRQHRAGRLLLAVFGFAGIAALAWSAAQPYLFVRSIFPATVVWAGIALLALAVTIVLSALFPRVEDRSTSRSGDL